LKTVGITLKAKCEEHEVNEHIAAFLSKGGKIQEVTENVLIRKKKSSPVFVIDYTKDSSLYGPYKKTN